MFYRVRRVLVPLFPYSPHPLITRDPANTFVFLSRGACIKQQHRAERYSFRVPNAAPLVPYCFFSCVFRFKPPNSGIFHSCSKPAETSNSLKDLLKAAKMNCVRHVEARSLKFEAQDPKPKPQPQTP